MSSAAVMAANTSETVCQAMLELLRGAPAVQAVFGDPARVFDDETERAAFPYGVIERVRSVDAGASCISAMEHRVAIAVFSRWGGRSRASTAVGVIRHQIETRDLSLPGLTIVLQQVLYSDIFRTADRRAFRGVLDVRIITEEAA